MIRGRTMLEAFGPDRVRELNSLTVISYLRGVDSATVTQLSQATGLSRTSISSTVAHLEKLGWILSLPPANGNLAGRPAKRYRFASTAGLVLGVDIGANRVSALLTDLNGAELGYAEDPVSPRTPAATRVERTHGVIDEALNRAEVDAQRVSVVSAGLTGPVDLEGNSPFGNTLPGWSSVNIVQDLSERYGRKVLVENDCKLALTAEAWRGQAIGVSNGAFIMAGARVGAAFMIDGVVCRGGGGAAGEVGALDILRWAKAPAIFNRHPDLPKGLPLIMAAEWVCSRMRGGDRWCTSSPTTWPSGRRPSRSPSTPTCSSSAAASPPPRTCGRTPSPRPWPPSSCGCQNCGCPSWAPAGSWRAPRGGARSSSRRTRTPTTCCPRNPSPSTPSPSRSPP